MSSIHTIKEELRELSNPEKIKGKARFFKNGKGQYGEGDIFLGLTMGEQRMIAKKFSYLSLPDVEQLLHSPEHEFRMVALLILVNKFKKGEDGIRSKIFQMYLDNTRWINNWDLVDASAYNIIGPYLLDRGDKMKILKQLALSDILWERRIAIVSTFTYVKQCSSTEVFELAEILLDDKEDLIHKAVGWMLREYGKRRNEMKLEKFLQKHYEKIPRTTLRYAIEKFPEEKRKDYLNGTI